MNIDKRETYPKKEEHSLSWLAWAQAYKPTSCSAAESTDRGDFEPDYLSRYLVKGYVKILKQRSWYLSLS